MLASYSEIAEPNRAPGQWRRPGTGVDEREPQPAPVLQLAGGGQLRRGVVQANRPRATARQLRRHVPSAAAQLYAGPAVQISRQHARCAAMTGCCGAIRRGAARTGLGLRR
jgi:hypothetical protein